MRKFSLSLLFLILLFTLTGCDDTKSYISAEGADALFAIQAGTEVDAEHKDVLNLIDIGGKTFDSADGLEFTLPAGCTALELTGTDGVFKAGDVSVDTSVDVKVSDGTGTMTLRVAIYANYDPFAYEMVGDLYIPYGVTDISKTYSISQITSAVVPSTVTEISEKAFNKCTAMTKVVLPDTIKSIGNFAFKQCSALKQLDIPDSVKSIGLGAFRQCKNLESVKLPAKIKTIENYVFYDCKSLQAVELPASVSTIGNYAFQNCYALTSISFSSKLTSIGEWAFTDCSALTQVILPDSLTTIGAKAFMNCKALTEVYIPETLESLGEMAFNGCKSVTKLTMPMTIAIPKATFSGMKYLEQINLTGQGESLEYDDTTFQYTPWYVSRDNAPQITIAEGITKIGSFTFLRCSGISSIKLPDTLQVVGYASFRRCTSLKSVELPEAVITIEPYAFSYCSALEDVGFDDQLTEIGSNAFSYCLSLKKAELPDSVTTIGRRAFFACNALESITLGVSDESALTFIDEYAFAGFCGNLKSITIYSKDIITISRGAFGFAKNKAIVDRYAYVSKNCTILVQPGCEGKLINGYNYCLKGEENTPYPIVSFY